MGDEASPPARLIIADDHDLIRLALRAMLQGEAGLEVVGEAGDGREALDLKQRAVLRPTGRGSRHARGAGGFFGRRGRVSASFERGTGGISTVDRRRHRWWQRWLLDQQRMVKR